MLEGLTGLRVDAPVLLDPAGRVVEITFDPVEDVSLALQESTIVTATPRDMAVEKALPGDQGGVLPAEVMAKVDEISREFSYPLG